MSRRPCGWRDMVESSLYWTNHEPSQKSLPLNRSELNTNDTIYKEIYDVYLKDLPFYSIAKSKVYFSIKLTNLTSLALFKLIQTELRLIYMYTVVNIYHDITCLFYLIEFIHKWWQWQMIILDLKSINRLKIVAFIELWIEILYN